MTVRIFYLPTIFRYLARCPNARGGRTNPPPYTGEGGKMPHTGEG